MLKIYALFIITVSILFSSTGLHAQKPISGTILDSLTNEGIEGATVSIIGPNNSILTSISSTKEGLFTLKQVPYGAYTIKVSFIGYKNHSQQITINPLIDQKPVLIRLPLSTTFLDDVQINIPIPAVVLKGDTTEYNAASFTTEPYADADALIEQLPGVEIDADGKLIIEGEDVLRIMVDGKEFFSSDPRIAMKNLPADIIDKIQLIDERSDDAQFSGFDDGVRRKIINIVTKPDRRNGYFGKAAGGYGDQDRYNTGANINAFAGKKRLSINFVSNNVNQQDFSMQSLAGGETGEDPQNREQNAISRRNSRNNGGPAGLKETNNLAVNYNNEWSDQIKLNANYSFNNTDNSTISSLNREYLLGNRNNQLSIQHQQNTGKNQSHQADFKFDYKIDSNNSIIFKPNIRYQESSSISNSQNQTLLQTAEKVNSSIRNNDNSRNNFTLSGDFTYRRRLSTSGRTLTLTLNGSVNSNKGVAHNHSLTDFYNDAILNRSDTVSNENNTNADGNGWTSRIAYTEPINKTSRLQANYSLRNTNNYSNRETFNFLAETGQFDELNTRLSNEFKNDYLYHSGGLGYLFSKGIYRFNVGMDFQQAQIHNLRIFPIENKTDGQFSSYLPNASFTYRVSKQKEIEINYTTATKAPSINQLQDVINNQNTLNIRVGNADLKQEYGHRFALNYKTANREKGTNFSVRMNAELSNNKIVNSILLASQDTLIGPDLILRKDGRFTKPENADGYYNIRANMTFGIPLKSLKMNMNFNTGAFYTHDIGLLNNETTFSNSSGFNQRIRISSRISQNIIYSFTLSGNYSVVKNNQNPDLSYKFYNQNLRNDFTFIFWKGIRTSSTLNYLYNTGFNDVDSRTSFLWNASIGKKLFKRQDAEITLTAYDLLKSNFSVSRNISEQFIEDRENNILNPYFILSFTYNLRKFGGGGKRPRL